MQVEALSSCLSPLFLLTFISNNLVTQQEGNSVCCLALALRTYLRKHTSNNEQKLFFNLASWPGFQRITLISKDVET